LLLIAGKDFNRLPHVTYFLVQLTNQAQVSFFRRLPLFLLDADRRRLAEHLAGEDPSPGHPIPSPV
jgi:hypothetical protein